jgi:uncharacterized protein
MSEILVGLISGFIFGLGLCLSGLADPSVVQSFLDIAGAWNPALLFVMGAGLTVTLIGYRLVFAQGRPLWSQRFSLPTSTAIDAPLISGAVIFGVGWGLAGYCPGPALVSLASGRMRMVNEENWRQVRSVGGCQALSFREGCLMDCFRAE